MPNKSNHKDQLKQLGLAVIKTEAQAISNLENRINENFVHACELMLKCEKPLSVDMPLQMLILMNN